MNRNGGLVTTGVTLVVGFVVVLAAPVHPSASDSPPPVKLVTASLPATTPGSEPSGLGVLERPVVILYGDSLAWEARTHFRRAFEHHPGIQVVERTFSGTAICDWLSAMREDAASLAPGAIVVEFSGNALTPCMHEGTQALQGDELLERYRSDADALVRIFEPMDTRIYFAGAPGPRNSSGGDFNGGRLNRMYREIAQTSGDGVEYVDSGAAVLDSGRWTQTLPCLQQEPCEGGFDAQGRAVNVVRAPDGNHFCPNLHQAHGGVIGTCEVWSSGAFRYGAAMARPILGLLSR
jgi:hypothetical protein